MPRTRSGWLENGDIYTVAQCWHGKMSLWQMENVERSMVPITFGTIAIQLTGNSPGGYYFYSLNTGKEIHLITLDGAAHAGWCNQWNTCLARRNHAPEGLAITTRYRDEENCDDNDDSTYQPDNVTPEDDNNTRHDDGTYNRDQDDNVSIREEGHPDQEDHNTNDKAVISHKSPDIVTAIIKQLWSKFGKYANYQLPMGRFMSTWAWPLIQPERPGLHCDGEMFGGSAAWPAWGFEWACNHPFNCISVWHPCRCCQIVWPRPGSAPYMGGQTTVP